MKATIGPLLVRMVEHWEGGHRSSTSRQCEYSRVLIDVVNSPAFLCQSGHLLQILMFAEDVPFACKFFPADGQWPHMAGNRLTSRAFANEAPCVYLGGRGNETWNQCRRRT